MTIEEQKKLLEEKKIVSKKFMGWNNCMYRYWNPQDPEKATQREWQEIYSKMDKEFFHLFFHHIYGLRNRSYQDMDTYAYFLTVTVDIQWKALLLAIKDMEEKVDDIGIGF
jgi:hypothetical protein